MSTLVRLERVVGRAVRDSTGKKIGHLHEARARAHGDELVVVDYLVGAAGLLERFSVARFNRELARLLGVALDTGGYVVPWDRMDLTHADGPRCTCPAQALQRFSGEPPETR